jgi:hypothetical protein
MNDYAPQHSRLFKEASYFLTFIGMILTKFHYQMILVSSPSKPFTYTAKGTPRRHAIIKEYSPEIDALYATVDESMQADISPPSGWSREETIEFTRAVVTRSLKQSIADTQDLFQCGCDRYEV